MTEGCGRVSDGVTGRVAFTPIRGFAVQIHGARDRDEIGLDAEWSVERKGPRKYFGSLAKSDRTLIRFPESFQYLFAPSVCDLCSRLCIQAFQKPFGHEVPGPR